jgi:hypothetical protein
MALHSELQVYKDTYKLILEVFEMTKTFPREYKYTLGQDMKRDTMELVRMIYRANRSKDKTPYLEAFLEQFELIKLQIRLSVDLRILSMKKQAQLAELLISIGKQVTGWKNYAQVK